MTKAILPTSNKCLPAPKMSATQQAKEIANSSSTRQETTSDIDSNKDQYNNEYKIKVNAKKTNLLTKILLKTYKLQKIMKKVAILAYSY